MAPLHRALALEEMHDVAVRVGEHLDLDVPRTLDEALDVERAVAERRLGLAARALDGVEHLACVAHDLHADAAAARRRLDERWKPDRGPAAADERGIGLIGRRLTRHDRHAGLLHQPPRADLRSHPLDAPRAAGRRSQAGVSAGAREARALGEEAVAGMHGVGAARSRGVEQRSPRSGNSRRRAMDQCGSASSAASTCGARRIGIGIDGDGLDAELAAGADDAQRRSRRDWR